MDNPIPVGVWPTMITPYTEDDRLDYAALEKMIDWYVAHGVAGLFAVCQSSEMFFLSLEERTELAARCVELAHCRVPVIASGHISEKLEDQTEELRRMADTGVDAVVLINNILASVDESDDIWKSRCEFVMDAVPESMPLGLYECPYPYKREVTPDVLRWCSDTDRFVLLKDTSCDPEKMRARQQAVNGTGFKIFNANAATLMETLGMGLAGYSGVMANFHPELYVWLCDNWNRDATRAKEIQAFLGLASGVEGRLYPRNAKYYQQLEGIPISLHTRRPADQLGPADRRLVEQFRELSHLYRDRITR